MSIWSGIAMDQTRKTNFLEEDSNGRGDWSQATRIDVDHIVGCQTRNLGVRCRCGEQGGEDITVADLKNKLNLNYKGKKE